MADHGLRNREPKNASGKTFGGRIIDLAISSGNGLVSLLSGLLALVLIVYSGYVLYDTVSIEQKASSASWDLLKFKPEIIDDDDVALNGPSLRDINSDYRAWLTVNNTTIDYPVVQGADDLYYASHDIYGNSSLTGAIYLAAGNSGDFSDSYNLIYGHHMDSGAMFGGLDAYMNAGYFNSHRDGVLVTNDTVFDIKFFAVLTTDAYESRIYTVGNRMHEVLEFIASGGEDGVGVGTNVLHYDAATAAGAIKLIALSTCVGAETSGRLVVIGRLIARTMNMNLRVTKVWNDNNNQDGVRPLGLAVTLLADGEAVEKYTLSAANQWTATAEGMPIYHEGNAITYTWTEPEIPGYTLTSTTTETAEDGTAVTTLTNTHEPVLIDLTVVKNWVDEDDSARPDSLNMVLTGGGTTQIVTLNAANEWTATVTGLPAYRNGTAIEYTWTEPTVSGYIQTDAVTTDFTTVFTNTQETPTDEDEYSLTIYYIYLNGTTAAETHYSVHQAGDAYDVVSPAIPGYKPTMLHVSGIMPAMDQVFTVIYIPDDLEIIDDSDTPLGIGQVFMNVGDCLD